jgi:hypothetical protein
VRKTKRLFTGQEFWVAMVTGEYVTTERAAKADALDVIWVRRPDGTEFGVDVKTLNFKARPGHVVTLAMGHTQATQGHCLGVYNHTTGDVACDALAAVGAERLAEWKCGTMGGHLLRLFGYGFGIPMGIGFVLGAWSNIARSGWLESGAAGAFGGAMLAFLLMLVGAGPISGAMAQAREAKLLKEINAFARTQLETVKARGPAHVQG